MKKLLFTITLLMLLGIVVYSQDEIVQGKNELMFWGGFSPDSSTFIRGTCRTYDARYGIFGIRYSRRFNNNNLINLKYTSDFIPLAVLNYPEKTLKNGHQTTSGYGIAPLGLQINFRPRSKYHPFIGASGGLLYLDKQTPNRVGTRFVYTADVGVGLQIQLKKKRSITFGYKYYHISNGGRGQQNPGFDNNLFYCGFTIFTK